MVKTGKIRIIYFQFYHHTFCHRKHLTSYLVIIKVLLFSILAIMNYELQITINYLF